MALAGFNETYYLTAKLAQLRGKFDEWDAKSTDDLKAYMANVGMTPEEHYEKHGWTEDLNPNEYFNAYEYVEAKAQQLFDANKYVSLAEAKAAFEAAWTGNPYDHYLKHGGKEGVNPSNAFDNSAYLDAKVADLTAKGKTQEDGSAWTADALNDYFATKGLTPLTHFLKFGEDEGLTAPEVPADKQVDPDPGPTTPGETFPLTTGVDEFTGTAGNDTFTGLIDDTKDAVASTFTALDDLDGGDGTDTLKLNILNGAGPTGTGVTALPNVSVNNIETMNLKSAVDFGVVGVNDTVNDGTNDDNATVSSLVDLSGYAGLTTINVNQGTDVSLKAATTTDVNVSGVTGAVEIAEARNVDVTHTKADQNITVGSYVAAAADDANTSGEITGTIDITDTDQGSGVIIVDGGTDVSVTTTSETATGTITVGANTAATGTVNVTQNLESDGEAALNNTTDGGIAVTGGTSITINSNATSDAKDKDSDAAITMHDISATGSEDTTEVTVTQTKTINTVSTPAEDEVKATHEVTFKALNAGQTTTLNGLTFTASTNMAAADVAQAFANLTVDDTQSETGPTANGFYTGAFNTASGWTSGAADGAKVVFTAPAFDTAAKMTVAGDVEADVTAAIVAGSDAVAKDESANDITYGDVAVDDHAGTADATVETITIDGYKDAVIGGANNVDALTDLTLRNSDGTTALSTAVTSLNLTLDNMGDASTAAVSLDTSAANVETLTITTENEASDVDLTAAAVTALTVNAGVDLDLSSSTMSTVLGTVSVTGAGAVDLSDISTASALNSFDASGNAGGVTATIDANSANVGDIEEYIFSDGDDAVSLADATVDVDVTLAAGDDVLTLESFGDGTITNVGTDTTLTAALDGGAGTNTLQMSAGDAAAASGAVTFETKISGFQKLELGAAQVTDDGTNDTDVTIDLANMDDINYVIANGTVMANDTATSADGALILNNLANNGTVELNGEGNVEVGVTDADTGTADSLNLVGNAAKGVVTAADVETVNIDAAAGDSTFVLTADSVETIVITGDEFVNLTDAADYASAALGDASSIVNTGNSLTMIDASAMTDGGIVAATSLAEQTIKGGAGADYLTADNGKAVIEGGAGDDTIYVTDGATSAVIDGGAGADTFDITGAALGVEAFATFNNVDAGDTFMLNAASFSSEAVDMTLDDPSTSDWINAAFSQTSADESIWFQHNGNTYIAVNDATSGDDAYDAADVVVKLTGLVDLSAASFNDAGTLELA